MASVPAYAAFDARSPLAPFTLERRAPGPRDVEIEILYCGVCHSDLHTVRSEWSGTTYPCVPGHEIVGRVLTVGAEVTRLAIGDHAGVGCMVGSCGACASCRAGLEQYCADDGTIWTYNTPDPHGTAPVTYGGYASRIVVDEAFCLRLPAGLALAGVAPLLCAGVTTWSPLVQWQAGPGTRVGVVGLGGLGHMAIQLAHARGAEVTLFTTSPGKADDARRLGARHVVVTTDGDAMRQVGGLDLIIDTVSAAHDLDPLLARLGRDGTLCLVGVPEHPHPAPTASALINQRRRLAGSLIGGIRETQELLDFCGAHGIVSEVEVIAIQQIEDAYRRMLRGDVRYRFVIDLASLRAA